MRFTFIYRLFLAIVTLKSLLADPQTGDGILATKDTEEVDFSIPQLDPRNPFYRGRPPSTFGAHADPTQHVDEIGPSEDFPTPVEFYERYIKEYKPVVMRGVARHSPAYHLWTEEYLKETYGDLTVRLEARWFDVSAAIVPPKKIFCLVLNCSNFILLVLEKAVLSVSVELEPSLSWTFFSTQFELLIIKTLLTSGIEEFISKTC